jgi:hypothetical protein
MKLRTFVADALLAGFLSAGVPAFVNAQEQRGMGDYDAHHTWHSDSWWYEHHPHWVETHHPEWAKNGDWDEHHHHWYDRDWWKTHNSKWAHDHHSDWF